MKKLIYPALLLLALWMSFNLTMFFAFAEHIYVILLLQVMIVFTTIILVTKGRLASPARFFGCIFAVAVILSSVLSLTALAVPQNTLLVYKGRVHYPGENYGRLSTLFWSEPRSFWKIAETNYFPVLDIPGVKFKDGKFDLALTVEAEYDFERALKYKVHEPAHFREIERVPEDVRSYIMILKPEIVTIGELAKLLSEPHLLPASIIPIRWRVTAVQVSPKS
ncbi:MAG: hypothetical protein HYT43_01650 [Candidatus Taylorbacteria bacterium]|nr:hypothetical protein [Candidatus Taylorbacteria bacterium]